MPVIIYDEPTDHYLTPARDGYDGSGINPGGMYTPQVPTPPVMTIPLPAPGFFDQPLFTAPLGNASFDVTPKHLLIAFILYRILR